MSSIGHTDNVDLVSNCPHILNGLLYLAIKYAHNYHMKKVPEKTKLMVCTLSGQGAHTG